MTKIYHYSPNTGEFLYQMTARLDPIEGKPIIEGFSTIQAPPVAGANQIAATVPVLNFNGTWELKPDYRGQTWYAPDGTPIIFNEIGQAPAPEMTETLPVDVELQQAKDKKENEMNVACADTIGVGFSSDALGTVHNYPSNTTDQLNLNGCVTESLLNPAWSGPFWCEAGDIWDRRIHTTAQIQAVGVAGAAHVRGNQDHYKTKLQEIQAATTVVQVEAIVW